MRWGSFFAAVWTCILVAAYIRGFYIEKNLVTHVITLLLVVTAFFIGYVEGEDE